MNNVLFRKFRVIEIKWFNHRGAQSNAQRCTEKNTVKLCERLCESQC